MNPPDDTMDRRQLLTGVLSAGAGLTALSALAESAAAATAATAPEPLNVIDAPGFELVLNIVATCSDPIATGGPEVKGPSRDGVRDEIWPIIGGRFWGKGIRGSVVPGGGDFPVVRPDGVVFVDALYRLRTDDGVTIVIHNKGIAYPTRGEQEVYRLQPEFFAPAGRYDWLNKAMFVATLVYPVPPGLAIAQGPHENDRLIQVFKVT